MDDQKPAQSQNISDDPEVNPPATVAGPSDSNQGGTYQNDSSRNKEIEECFSFEFVQKKEDRIWSQIDYLKSIPERVKKGQLEQALSILDNQTVPFSDFDFIYAWKAQIFHKQGDTDAAVTMLHNGLNQARTKHLLYDRLGFLAAETGDMESAVKCWIKSIVVMSKYGPNTLWEPYLYLAYIARACGLAIQEKILMQMACKICLQGAPDLTPDAAQALLNNASSLKSTWVPRAVHLLCDAWIKEASNKEKSTQEPIIDPVLADTNPNIGFLPPLPEETSNKNKTIAVITILVLVIMGVYLFFFRSAPAPMVKVPDTLPKQQDIQKKTLPLPVVQPKVFSGTKPIPLPQEIPPVPEKRKPIIEQLQSIKQVLAPESPTTHIEKQQPQESQMEQETVHKAKLPYLKPKTKLPEIQLQKKNGGYGRRM